ncbi:MAG: hypothetical protein JWN76_1280 [Chitinophagaceae bacterium]|nr:hypothetical protein [Chitinophagaceae bacterium]
MLLMTQLSEHLKELDDHGSVIHYDLNHKKIYEISFSHLPSGLAESINSILL